ncbi:MAG: TetR/AcrR family transcriptional regulator [Thermoleophilia bacterium]|nr:TetR/AcrR family transcriptional regulator [Thermoleophilia bacterium]
MAAGLFRERGYDATSMQEIADRMGILKGSVYHYVKTKEDLLWMVVEPPLLELVTNAQEILTEDGRPLSERLRRAMIAHAESFEEHYPHMFVMTRENGETLSAKRRQDLDGLRRKYFQVWRKAIVEGQKTGEIRSDVDPSIAVHGIFGMINWMFRWFKTGGRASARDVADQFATIAIDGLLPGGS